MLRDHCPVCKAILEPHRLTAGDGRLDRCATCRSTLLDVVPIPLDTGALQFQRLADSVYQTGIGKFGSRELSAPDWFAFARFLSTLLWRMSAKKAKAIDAFLAALGVAAGSVDRRIASGLSLELLPVSQRAETFRSLSHLLATEPDQMLAAAQEAKLTRAALEGVGGSIPGVLRATLSRLPDGHRGIRKSRQPVSRSPRSPSAVLACCVRLQRRMGRM
jgi:hypothetical protein